MTCEVYGCRYSAHHTTENHKCGTCHKKGHGKRGCPINNAGGTYVKYATMSKKKINKIKKMDPKKFSLDRLIYHDIPVGKWTYGSIGMGRDVVCRNNNGRFEYFTTNDRSDPSVSTSDLYMTKNFINGYDRHIVYQPYTLFYWDK